MEVRNGQESANGGPGPCGVRIGCARRDHGRDGAALIKGLGEYAFQASSIRVTTEVAALKGKLVIAVHFSGAQPVTDEQVAATLALAKKVVKKV